MTGEAEPSHRVPESAPRFVTIIDDLHHCEFDKALTSSGLQTFYAELSRVANIQTSGIGEIFLQVHLDEEEPTSPEDIRYIGIHYNFVVNDEGVTLESTGIYIPDDGSVEPESDPDLLDAHIIIIPYENMIWEENSD